MLYRGVHKASFVGVIKRDTRSSDYSVYGDSKKIEFLSGVPITSIVPSCGPLIHGSYRISCVSLWEAQPRSGSGVRALSNSNGSPRFRRCTFRTFRIMICICEYFMTSLGYAFICRWASLKTTLELAIPAAARQIYEALPGSVC